MKLKRPEEWLNEFDAIEQRFAPQARIAVVLVLLSGLYMVYAYDLWNRFTDIRYWWMDLMVGVWLLFAALLFPAAFAGWAVGHYTSLGGEKTKTVTVSAGGTTPCSSCSTAAGCGWPSCAASTGMTWTFAPVPSR